MKLDDLLDKKSEWLKGEGLKANIAMSTRVRIARNLDGHLYYDRANEAQRKETLDTVMYTMQKSKFLKDALFLEMKDVSEVDRNFLVERHLMSREHVLNAEHKGLVFDETEIVSAMMNEEDHIRLQAMQSGFNVMETWRMVDEIDTELEEYLTFDYSDKFGYLTSCPTNTGTGLRASVMVHLSALAMIGQVDNVFKAISKLGLTMRGFYGEGTEALGDFFQISNQVALGHSEMDILDNLGRIVNRIILREEQTREKLLKTKKQELMDGIARSYGTLKSARIITSSETVKLLSTVRLGADLGLLKDIDIAGINEIFLLAQPAHLQKITNKELTPYERDIERADLIRKKLAGDVEK